MEEKLKNTIGIYMEGIRDGNFREAVTKYTGDRYTQHSTGVRDGAEGFIEFFEGFVENNPKRDIQIVRSISDEKVNKVFLQAHQKITNNAGDTAEWVTTDFFDFDTEGKIIEHWDVIAPYISSTPSGHTSTDGPTEITNTAATEQNKAIVRNMIKDILMPDGDKSKIEDYFSSEQLTQHTELNDDLEELKKFVLNADTERQYTEIVLLVGEGDFVATLSKVSKNGKPYAQVDVFRLENGKIVEHWDNTEPVLEQSVNSGKF